MPAIGQRIGYAPKEVAAWLASILDGGVEYQCTVPQIGIHPDNPHLPGAYVEGFLVDGTRSIAA